MVMSGGSARIADLKPDLQVFSFLGGGGGGGGGGQLS